MLVLATSGCGRVDFDLAAGNDAGITLSIVDLGEVHHLGDNSVSKPPQQPEGPSFTRSFTLPNGCARALLDIDFPGPYGPYRDFLPVASINDVMLESMRPQFPADDDPGWLNGNWDNQPPLLVSLDTSTALHNGDNVFMLVDGTTTDDFFFDGVELRCF